jgi:hypothetical protein
VRGFALSTIALVLSALAALAETPDFGPDPVESQECTQLTLRLLEAGGEIERKTAVDVVFKALGGIKFNLECHQHSATGLNLSWNSSYPPRIWFALGSRLGEIITGEKRDDLERAMRKCIVDGLSGRGSDSRDKEHSEITLPKALVDCISLMDGEGAHLTVWLDDDGIHKLDKRKCCTELPDFKPGPADLLHEEAPVVRQRNSHRSKRCSNEMWKCE